MLKKLFFLLFISLFLPAIAFAQLPDPSSICSFDPIYADPLEPPPPVVYQIDIGFVIDGVEDYRTNCFGTGFSFTGSSTFAPAGQADLTASVSEGSVTLSASAAQSGITLDAHPRFADLNVTVTPWVLSDISGSTYFFNGEQTSFINTVQTAQSHPDTTASTQYSSALCNGCTETTDIVPFSGTVFPQGVISSFPEIAAEAVYVKTRDIKAGASVNVPSTENSLYPGPNGAEASNQVTAAGVVHIENYYDDGLNCSADSKNIGNPINVATGNKYQSATDYQGAGDNPLSLVRSYNSRQTAKDSPFGPGWTHNFNSRIDFLDGDRKVRVWRPDGRAFFHNWIGGGWDKPADFFGRFFIVAATGDYEFTENFDDKEIYDQFTGKLKQVIFKTGYTQDFTYTNGLLTQVSDLFGKTLTFTYNAENRVQSLRDPSGQVITYEYDTSGNLKRVNYPDVGGGSTSVEYHYEDTNFPNALTGMTDETGERVSTYAYEEIPYSQQMPYRDVKRAILTEKAGGAESFSQSNAANLSTSFTNAAGRESVYAFKRREGRYKIDNIEGLETAPGGCPATSKFNTFTTNGMIETQTDKEGNVTEFTYDFSNTRVETETTGLRWENDVVGSTVVNTPDTTTTTKAWLNLKPTSITTDKLSTTFTYNPQGRLERRTETDVTTQTVPYSTNGRQRSWNYSYTFYSGTAKVMTESIDGPRTDVNDTTVREFDAEGNLTKVTNPLGHITLLENYDANGRPGRITDANGTVTNLTYHPRGWLLTSSLSDPELGAITTEYQYHPNGLLKRVILPNNSYLEYQYNAAEHLTALIAGEKSGTTFTEIERIDYTPSLLDGEWESATTKDGAGTVTRVQTRVFDELGRLKELLGANSQQTLFDYDKNDLLGLTSEVGETSTLTTSNEYDSIQRLKKTTDALSGEVDYAYDTEGNITSISDQRDNTTSYIYDGFGNLIQESSPDAGTVVYHYDLADNLSRKIDARGIETLWAYDALNRITQISFPANPAENKTFEYDIGTNAKGRLNKVSDEAGITSYAYDARGNQTLTSRVTGLLTLATSYHYNSVDQVDSITYPSGRVVEFSFDALGRPNALAAKANVGATATSLISNITYKPFGPPNSMDFSNGLSRNLSFDTDYRITGIDVSDGTSSVQNLSYQYDRFNNITILDNNLNSTYSQGFFYDNLHRLTEASGGYGQCSFTYDAVGNRTQKQTVLSGNTETEIYAYPPPGSGNRLLSVDDGATTRSFSYDAAGNVTNDDKGTGTDVTLEFNNNNRLTSVDATVN